MIYKHQIIGFVKRNLLIFLIFLTFLSHAQQWQWAKTVFESGTYPVLHADDIGNTYFAASTSSLSAFDGVVLGKYNPNGVLLWKHVVEPKSSMSVFCQSVQHEVN